jgi:hypothetical protein
MDGSGLRVKCVVTPQSHTQESRAVSPNALPSDRFGSAHSTARRSGRACRFGCRNDRSDGSGEHAEMCSSNGPANCVREEQGGPPGGCPLGPLPGGPRKSWGDARQGTDLPGDARSGRLGSRVGSGLKFDVRMRFRFPRKVSLPLPANLRNVFPRRTPIGRESAVRSVGSCKLSAVSCTLVHEAGRN